MTNNLKAPGACSCEGSCGSYWKVQCWMGHSTKYVVWSFSAGEEIAVDLRCGDGGNGMQKDQSSVPKPARKINHQGGRGWQDSDLSEHVENAPSEAKLPDPYNLQQWISTGVPRTPSGPWFARGPWTLKNKNKTIIIIIVIKRNSYNILLKFLRDTYLTETASFRIMSPFVFQW